MKVWKLIVALSAGNLVVGLVVVAIGVAYDFLGRSPGTIAMTGVALMSGPWLLIAIRLRHELDASKNRSTAALAERPLDVVRELSNTEAHRTIQAIISSHGGGVLAQIEEGED